MLPIQIRIRRDKKNAPIAAKYSVGVISIVGS